MLIVLEGIDLAGKTTIANEISRLTGAEYRHRGQPDKRSAMDEYALDLLNYTPGSGKHIVCDRWHLGDFTYGPIYRNEKRLAWHQTMFIESLLDRLGALKVIVTQSMETLAKRRLSRDEDYLKEEHVSEVHKSYQYLARRLDWLTWTPSGNPQEVYNVISDGFRMEANAIPLADLGGRRGYLGPTRPDILLVGTDHSHIWREGKLLPQFMPYEYLNPIGYKLYQEAYGGTSGLDVRESIGIIPTEHINKSAHRLLGSPKTVALGGVAHQRLLDSDIPHRQALHPEWFHADTKELGIHP